MKKKYSIGFFTVALAAFLLLAAAYNITYRQAMDRAEEEIAIAKQEAEDLLEGQSVAADGQAQKEDGYYLKEVNGYVVVYQKDKKTAYEYTSIAVASLPSTLQNEIKNGKYIESTQMLYSFLENYSS